MIFLRTLAPPLLALVLFGTLAGCRSAVFIPDEQVHTIARDVEGRTVYLRSSMNVLPFYSDRSLRLVTAWPEDSVGLLEDTRGDPMLPGPAERVLMQGTRVRVDRLEMPTGVAIAHRPLVSPRTSPWVYLSVTGEQPLPRLVVVLRPGMRTREELLVALDQVFCEAPPEGLVEGYSAAVREAIRQKRLVPEMDVQAVELAWGRPERIHQQWEDGVRVESWTWPLGRRTATFRDGKLTASVPAWDPASAPSPR